MQVKELHNIFSKTFDVVGIINTKTYLEEAKKMHKEVPDETYSTMVVLGLAYPYRRINHTRTHFVPSFYTFGKDYHTVLKNRIKQVMDELDLPYHMGVDNHPHDERLAAVLAGVGFFGKNQLIINQDLGSYMFLGIVFIDIKLEHEFRLDVTDDCGTCRRCIDACPTQALDEGSYDVNKCMSHFNQAKKILTPDEITSNVSLFGCDICQMVCPKNIKKGVIVHPEFELSGKEMVSIVDLFTQSEKDFKTTYNDMSYLWKGKTILMRNALTLMLRQKNTNYIQEIEKTLMTYQAPWYQETATRILDELKRIKENGQ